MARSEGNAGSFKGQVPRHLEKAEGLRGAGQDGGINYLLVIVMHACRSYLPITSITGHILGTNS